MWTLHQKGKQFVLIDETHWMLVIGLHVDGHLKGKGNEQMLLSKDTTYFHCCNHIIR